MDKNEDDLQLGMYRPPSFTGGCLEIRLFYVRIAPCAVENLPDQLKLRHLRREIGVSLEINGARIPSSNAVSVALRRDRVDKDSSEATYVSTDSVKLSGPAEFEVCEERGDDDLGLILCGSLQRVDAAAAWSNGNALDGDSRTGWSMECYVANSIASGRSALIHPKSGVSSPSIEVYIAGCCSGTPVILTKTILVSPRKKVSRQGMMLDAIPEDEEMGKEQRSLCNGLVRQRKSQFMGADMDDYDLDGKVGFSYYPEYMYTGEDGELSWFNAGVRVGVGIGLGVCLGIGVGVGLLMRSYQATTRNFRRRFF